MRGRQLINLPPEARVLTAALKRPRAAYSVADFGKFVSLETHQTKPDFSFTWPVDTAAKPTELVRKRGFATRKHSEYMTAQTIGVDGETLLR